MKLSKFRFFVFALAALASCTVTIVKRDFNYPYTRQDITVDDYHGTKVADPYRWLENSDSPDVRDWIDEQNKITRSYLDSIQGREKVKERLTQIANYAKFSVPMKVGDRYVFSRNDGLQNQFVLYMQKSLDSEPVVVIDPNKLSKDGTIALTNQAFSKDGKLLAYGLSSGGSDWQELKIRTVDTSKDYDETLKRCRYAGIAWKHDNSGFYYDKFPDLGDVPKEDETKHCRIYWHKLGTSQSEDKLVFEMKDKKEFSFSPDITEDGKYLVLHVHKGTDRRNGFYYREVDSSDKFIHLLEPFEARYSFVENIGSTFYFRTDLNAPRGRVVAIDVKKPDRRNWKEVIPQQTSDVMSFATMVNDKLIVAYLKDVHHNLRIYDLDGKELNEVSLPTLGTISSLSGKRTDKEMFFGFQSFLYPMTVFRYDFKTNKSTVFKRTEVKFDPSAYETKQQFYTSKDGTSIPMFIVHKKGLKLDGNNPTLLYGYGGFNVSLTPYFSVIRAVWMENGGVYAIANIRGGSEYGEAWHQAGMLDKKQNVFNDFIAAAEWLINNKYTNSSRLAIQGGSNGGLLVGACMVQRPDLFGAVLCHVPVIDMLRYHKWKVGYYWINEYGNAEEKKDHFKFLYAYSPLHNVRKGVNYPPIMITTGDGDDRVIPAHALKFAATLQEANTIGKTPILLRFETKAGHGSGKPLTKVIEEYSDIYAFLFKVFEMEYRD